MNKNSIKRILVAFLALFFVSGCSIGEYYEKNSDTGVGGSMNRFVIKGDYMYAVDGNNLKVFNLSVPENPKLINKINVGFSIETIYSLKTLLLIGSDFGVYVFDAVDPENPKKLDESMHVESCDPVVADDKYAYVTLSTSSTCGRGLNELQILDIRDPKDIELVKTYTMERPRGLAVSGDMLFVCDRYNVLIYDKTNVQDMELLGSISIQANDVIVIDSLLLLITDNQLEQYQIENTTDGLKATFLSEVYDFN